MGTEVRLFLILIHRGLKTCHRVWENIASRNGILIKLELGNGI